MDVKYPVLAGEIAKRGIKKTAINNQLGITDRALRNKLNGESPLTWEEASAIRNTFFPDMSLEALFATQ